MMRSIITEVRFKEIVIVNFFVNISIFLSHFFYFHGSKVRGYAHSVAQLQFPYKVGKIREPQAQFEKRPIRAVSKPASTALMHYKLRFE